MEKKKAKVGGALVCLVIDKSGSMEPIRKATIAGCNQFIAETRDADPEARISLVLFDTQVHKTFTAKPIADIEPIDGTMYHPGGGTALLDAMGKAMTDIEAMPDKPSKVVIAVITDGQENSSSEFTRAAVKAAVARHETEDKWQILYLGANVDSFAEAGAIGMARNASSVNWQQSAAGTQALYMSTSGSTGSFLRGHTATVDVSQDTYNTTLASIQNNAGTAPTPPITGTPHVRSRGTTKP